jgi:putative transposase
VKYNPEIHHRRSIRLKGYDYGQSGLYFITILAWQRQHIFGTIQSGKMQLSPFGEIASVEWLRTPQLRPNIELAEFVIMPNHVHGVIAIAKSLPQTQQSSESEQCKGTLQRALTLVESDRKLEQSTPTIEAFGKPTSNTIPSIIRGYKSAVTKQINILRNCPQCPVWHRNYYEHVIRSEADYLRIAAYILDNPRRWEEDSFHPKKSERRGKHERSL